ncbi:hypothetical protein EVAR_3482_1 [Eumeta japonica]|uniref:Uncharacterized protein n=1 Tax=Eumeta variegata TaxID=151549 RepID=A0A4C1STB0_EUMVA|nr:hypothetical protein EVAR_3482_1 [Eumeta japonica]
MHVDGVGVQSVFHQFRPASRLRRQPSRPSPPARGVYKGRRRPPAQYPALTLQVLSCSGECVAVHTRHSAARGRPIIVEWERRGILAGLSRSVTHRYVTERYTFQICASRVHETAERATLRLRIKGPSGTVETADEFVHEFGLQSNRSLHASDTIPALRSAVV